MVGVDMSLTKQDKEDIRGIMHEVINAEVTPRFDKLEHKLSNKIDGYHTVNVRHHLETRKMIGDLQQSHDRLREGIRSAAA